VRSKYAVIKTQRVSSLFVAELAQVVSRKADRLCAGEVDVVATQQMGDFTSELLGEVVVGFQTRYLGHRHDWGCRRTAQEMRLRGGLIQEKWWAELA
jgi:hypothetical protein